MRNVVLLLIIVLLVSCSTKKSVAKEEICGIRSEFYYVTDSVAQKIKSYEGLALKSYLDSGKRYAIGYGHTGDVKNNQKITKKKAERLFKSDLSRCMAFVSGLGICTTQNEFDALVSLVFNVGENSFLASRLYKEIQRWEEPELIRKEFSTWCYSNGKPSKGLEKRRKWETDLYLTFYNNGVCCE